MKPNPTPNPTETVSDCCKARLVVRSYKPLIMGKGNNGSNPNHHIIKSTWYECANCGKACDPLNPPTETGSKCGWCEQPPQANGTWHYHECLGCGKPIDPITCDSYQGQCEFCYKEGSIEYDREEL